MLYTFVSWNKNKGVKRSKDKIFINNLISINKDAMD